MSVIVNIIGITLPKLITLLTILISPTKVSNKLILIVILVGKFLLDYDCGKPGHRGDIYQLTEHLDFDAGELVVTCIQIVPAVIFLVATILMKLWVPFVPGIIAVLIGLSSIIREAIDYIEIRRRNRNADSNNK